MHVTAQQVVTAVVFGDQIGTVVIEISTHACQRGAVQSTFWIVAERRAITGIGARLAQLRKEKGITQAELAERLDISQPMASDYERGELRLHGELIIQLSEILGVSADEILGINVPKQNKTTVKNRRLSNRLQAIDQLPKRDQDALFRTIDAFISRA